MNDDDIIRQVTLSSLINILRRTDSNEKVPFSDRGDSYRGSYDQFALEPGEAEVADVLHYLENQVINRQFEGYKGGTYTMTAHTPVFVANWGEWSQKALAYSRSHGFVIVAESW